MYCTKCGMKNEEENKFCTKCGNELHQVQEEQTEKTKEEIKKEKKLREKEIIKNGPFSLKVAYYSRIILPVLVGIQLLIPVGWWIINRSIYCQNGCDDGWGWGLGAAMILGFILFPLVITYCSIIIPCDIFIPSKLIKSEEESKSSIKKYRVLILILLYIFNLLPTILPLLFALYSYIYSRV